jgi:hypothetical protein
MDTAIYAVGYTTTGVAGSEDYLIQKYDEAGNLLWSETSGGANTDVLNGVVGIGTRLFAVGYTNSSGAGGDDSVVLEIDPATGATLSTTLFGGALDDKANGAATDGTDLYVVGESRSFASDQGNTVGENDVMLLRYNIGAGGGDLTLTSAASRKTHGTKGDFDIDLPLTGNLGIECRTGLTRYTVVMTFNNNVTGADSASSSCGTIGSISVDPADAHNLLVTFNGAACDASTVTVTATNVHDDQGNTLGSASVSMGLLVGDVTGDGRVTHGDTAAVQAVQGQQTNSSNFRADVTADGRINNQDVQTVRSHRGDVLPY